MFTTKRSIILIIVIIAGFITGRLAVRGILNLLVGGTLFGGNFLWGLKRKEKEQLCFCLSVYVLL